MSSAIFCLCACFFPPLLKALWEHSLISVYLFHSLSSLVILCVHLHCSSLPPVFLICMFSSTCWSSVLSHWFMQCYSYKPFSPMLSHCSYLWIIHVYPIFLLSSACRECYLKRLLLACSIHGQYMYKGTAVYKWQILCCQAGGHRFILQWVKWKNNWSRLLN